VVINEVLYDAVGSDSGKEWLELYNNGDEDVRLTGWELQAGGNYFTSFFIFPEIWIRGKSFLLISEDESSQASIITQLELQNGGSCTDGVRLYDPRNYYFDTILYDSPNTNQLEDDDNNFDSCESVLAGHSLARINDGLDTNTPNDWFDCGNPTPQSSNIVRPDITISEVNISFNELSTFISTVILNLSTIDVDNVDISLKMLINSDLIYEEVITEILASSSVTISTSISKESSLNKELVVEINSNSNINIVDNMCTMWISEEYKSCKLSEVMYKPLVGASEWVELYLESDYFQEQVVLEDASASRCSAKISGNAGDYIVICQNRDDLLNQYNGINSHKVFEAESWIYLNNSGDRISLYSGTSLQDELTFTASDVQQGFSYEFNSLTNCWQETNSIVGGTPTSAYTDILPQPQVDLSIISKLISPRRSSCFKINLPSDEDIKKVELEVYDIQGRKCGIVTEEVTISSGEFTWNGLIANKSLKRGLYPSVIRISRNDHSLLINKQLIITITK
jgi:hypothetical protein